MNRYLVNAVYAVVGGAIAYITTSLYYQKKIDKITETHAEELEEVRNIYKTFHDETIKKADEIASKPKVIECNDVDKAIDYVNSLNYGPTQVEPDDSYPESEMQESTIYLITESEYGVLEHFDTDTLLYFEDEVLTDSNYGLVEEPQVFRNNGIFEALADSPEEMVFVRDMNKRCDYEIIYDLRNFRDDVLPMLTSPNED